MPAGKSPNNAFNLHKERMKSVLRDILLLPPPPAHEGRDIIDALVDDHLSKPYFYWGSNDRDGNRHLYSKGYINTQAAKLSDGWWGYRSPYLITKIREYYTDGVRAIGAME